MVKTKRKHLAEVVNDGNTQSAPENLSNVSVDSDFSIEDSWITVKKQRINILIPRLPGTEKSTMPTNMTNTNDESPPEVCLPDTNDGLMPLLAPETNTTQSTKQRKLHLRTPRNEDRIEDVMKYPITANLPSATAVVNRMMRASNLERKIVRAGGFSRWLSSLGLQQFVRIFHGRKVSKFQLANLSMQKLKDMGVHPVGPRRKLIHAIECLCEPCCFQGF